MKRYGSRNSEVSENSEIYVVMEGSKIGGVYYMREDANSHASAIAGSVVVQQIRYNLPTWVKTMTESSVEKARLQNPVRR